MLGILKIAYKLLVNDRAKFAALLIGITFAVALMTQMTSLFAGVLSRASATVFNTGATIWVMDPAVQTVANSIPMPDYVLDEVRSIPGVKYAVPLYSGAGLAKLKDGTYQAVNVWVWMTTAFSAALPCCREISGTSSRKTGSWSFVTRNIQNWKVPAWARSSS